MRMLTGHAIASPLGSGPSERRFFSTTEVTEVTENNPTSTDTISIIAAS